MTALAGIITGDLIYAGYNHGTHLISPSIVGLCVVFVFVAIGERITKLIVNKSGITIEQRPEDARNQVDEIASLATAPKVSERISRILQEATGHRNDVWSRMVMYRLMLRMLMRRVCEPHGMPMGAAPSIQSMLQYAAEKKLLTPSQLEKAELLRNVSYYFEWGTPPAPAPDEIQTVLSMSSRLLSDIARTAENVIVPVSPVKP